jgi:iron only hydrogenase large subunit-like protein
LPRVDRPRSRKYRRQLATAAMAPRLSSALTVADVNDFLTPAAACVLPLGGGAVASVAPAPPGSVLAPIIPTGDATATAAAPQTARVTLSDCLSCSGCVTSAETVLLSSTNLDKIRAALLPGGARAAQRGDLRVVVALSQQAVASIAVELGLGLQAAAGALATFFTGSLGADCVVDLAFARHFALEEAAAEFLRRRRGGESVVVASACPGWVTYAEKTQGKDVLNVISRVRSPQAIAGAVVPRVLGDGVGDAERVEVLGRSPKRSPQLRPRRRTWLMTVMPCHDKKLEAARPGYTGAAEDGQPDVEAVLTAGEVLQLAAELFVDVASLPPSPLDARFAAGPDGFGTATGSGSGGYAEYVLRIAARELLGVELPGERLTMEKVTRSGDVRSITVRSADGDRQLRFGTAYGFRSLQSVLRKIRRGECEYDYIELMACPGGCTNGGGQIPVLDGDKKAMTKQLVQVDAVYASAANPERPREVLGVAQLYQSLGASADDVLYTSYERREQNVIAAVNNW